MCISPQDTPTSIFRYSPLVPLGGLAEQFFPPWLALAAGLSSCPDRTKSLRVVFSIPPLPFFVFCPLSIPSKFGATPTNRFRFWSGDKVFARSFFSFFFPFSTFGGVDSRLLTAVLLFSPTFFLFRSCNRSYPFFSLPLGPPLCYGLCQKPFIFLSDPFFP